jgi:hypothetical protein
MSEECTALHIPVRMFFYPEDGFSMYPQSNKSDVAKRQASRGQILGPKLVIMKTQKFAARDWAL